MNRYYQPGYKLILMICNVRKKNYKTSSTIKAMAFVGDLTYI